MELREFLLWVFGGGGGAAAVAYWLMEYLPGLDNLSAEWRRYVSLVLAALVSWAAFGASVGLGYSDNPATWQGWLETLFALAFAAITLSQSAHGRLKLRRASGV